MPTGILVVEDDDSMRQMLVDRLSSLGYSVVSAPNAMKGVEAAIEYKPHLILTDFLMPSPAGESIFSGLAASPQTKDIPVIVMTGQPLDTVKGYVPLSMRTRLVSKPLNFKKLDKLIKDLTATPEPKGS